MTKPRSDPQGAAMRTPVKLYRRGGQLPADYNPAKDLKGGGGMSGDLTPPAFLNRTSEAKALISPSELKQQLALIQTIDEGQTIEDIAQRMRDTMILAGKSVEEANKLLWPWQNGIYRLSPGFFAP